MDISMAGTPLLIALIGIIVLLLALVIAMRSVYSSRSMSGLAERHEGKEATSPSERNKYPEANVFRLSGTFFNLGLALALGLTILAFSWTQYEEEVYIPEGALELDEDIEIAKIAKRKYHK